VSRSDTTEVVEFTARRKIVLGLFILAFVIMIYSVIPWADIGLPIPTLYWWFTDQYLVEIRRAAGRLAGGGGDADADHWGPGRRVKAWKRPSFGLKMVKQQRALLIS
jgi:hypothetical protein